MSLNKNLEEAKKLLKEINELKKQLGKEPIKAVDPKNIETARESLRGLQSELREMSSDLDYVSKSFKDSVNELSKQNAFLNDAKSSLKGISSISDKILQYRKGETSLSEKQLKTLQAQAKAKFDSLRNDIKSGQLGKENTKEAQEALKSESLFNSEIERTIKYQKQVNKEIGLLGTGLDGAAKVLSKMGFGDLSKPLQDAVDKTKNARLQQKLNNDEVKKLTNQLDSQNKKQLTAAQLRAGFGGKELKTLQSQKDALESQNKSLDSQTSKYKNIGKALKDQITSVNILDFVFKELIVAFGTSQKGIGELAKGLGMSASSATQMRQEFAGIANSSMNANISVKGLQDSQMAVGQALGTNAKLNEKDLITMTDIVKKTGMQHKELMGIQKLSLAQGKDLDKNLKSTLGGATAYASQNKLVVDVNRTLKEVNNASSSLKLSLGGSVEELGRAVMQTQKFGITLQQAESISKGLLSFEQSISDELEAELLTGKDLNFEKARQFALEGDIAKASEEVLKQLKGSEEFSKMNVIQQEAMAKAVGMTKDQLADSLIEREALQKMSAEEGDTALQAYEKLKASGKTQAEIVKMLGEESAEKLEQQSAQDKFNASVEKLREVFVQVMDAVAPIFDVLSSVVTTILPAINYALQPIMMMFSGLSKIISGNLEDLSGWEVILASIAAGVATIYTVTKATAAIQKGQQIIDGIRLGYQATMGSMEAKKQLLEKKGLALSIGKAAMGAIQSLASIPVVGWALGLAAAGTVAALGYSYMKDGMIGPGGEMVVSGPKGSIQLDKDDSIIAGTDLFGGDKKSNNSTTQQSTQVTQASVDMSQTNALLQQLISVIQSGGTVMLDGQKVGTALKLGTYQTQ
jgi:hypothetical protein